MQFDSGGFLAKNQTHPMRGVHLIFGGTIQRSNAVRFWRILSQKSQTPHERGVCDFWRHHPESNWRMAILQTAALPLGYGAEILKLGYSPFISPLFGGEINGAGNGARTRHLRLGKAALYQMSYSRKWCLRVELNHRHGDFQSPALPTELPRQIWRPEGGSNP